MSEDWSGTFQILALDGGGMKGAFTAALLASIEEDCGVKIADHFDLIAGTSTGGIIALGLGLGFSARELLDFYVSEGKSIFPRRILPDWLGRLLTTRYESEGLEHALKLHFKDRRLGDSKTRLVIPSYSIGEDDVHIFRTRHHERLKRDWKLPAWKVALATSAAPTYFPCSTEVDGIRLIDGGVWANNPSMVALVEAFGTLRVPLEQIRILNIATCDEISSRSKSLDRGGLLQWRRDAIEIITRGQSLAAANQASFLIGKGNFLRVAPAVPSGILKLDSTKQTDDLIGKAKHHSRIVAPEIQRRFLSHKAQKFSPET